MRKRQGHDAWVLIPFPQALEADLSHLRDEVVNMARATLMEHLGESGASEDAATPTNEQGEVRGVECEPLAPLLTRDSWLGPQ